MTPEQINRMAQKVDNLQLCSVAYHAGQMAQDAHAAYWCECGGNNSAEFLRKNVLEKLTEIAEIYGLELVEAGRVSQFGG